MRTRFLRLVPFAFCLVATQSLLAQASAQTASVTSEMTHAPDPDSGMSGGVNGLFIPLITGHPFHAKIAVQIDRQLPDGTTVAQKYYTLVARDSDGREYREARQPVPSDSDLEPALVSTRVYDPKTSLIVTCTPDQRICRQMTFDPTQHPVEEPAGPSPDGKSTLARESLGTKTMDGLQAVGTRETRTFSPGAFGNDKPVVVTKEIWYSPQLQFNLSVIRNDPRNGTQKLEVTDLKLGDPGKDWFVLPDGYRIVTGRGIQARPIYPTELEPLIEKNVTGMTSDQLSAALQPVEAAIGAYAKVHAAASPNDKLDAFTGQLRLRLSSDLRMIQQGNLMPNQKAQIEEADLRLNSTFREVVNSPCIAKPQPGDPPSVPTSAEGLRAEQNAWLALRDAWTAFLAKLFPNSDPTTFGWLLTNERDSELRRLQNIERNRGCQPVESIEPLLVRYVSGLSPDQLDAAVKPVDVAVAAYVKAQAASEPNSQNEMNMNSARMIDQQLSNDLRMQQRDRLPMQNQFAGVDLQLNFLYRTVISSPCLTKSIPGDPPGAPVSADKLRDEEQAWIAMREAWTAFLATVFPNGNKSTFGGMITQMRIGDLQRIENIERNRGCQPAESVEPQLVRFVRGMTPDQLDTAVKPVDAAIAAYAKAHAESEPNDPADNFVRMVEQQLSSDLNMQQQNRIPTRDQFEEADLHLNQAYRAVIASPCLSKPSPGDPPNAPVSEEKLRAEERAWIAMRDAWTAFLATVFPNADKSAFGTMLTEQRTFELQQIQNVERNRGCAPAE